MQVQVGTEPLTDCAVEHSRETSYLRLVACLRICFSIKGIG